MPCQNEYLYCSDQSTAQRTFSHTLRRGKMLVIWKLRARPRRLISCGRAPVMSAPFRRIVPALGLSRPLFNLVSGRLKPSAGTIRLNGADITGARPQEINRRGLARSFQITNIFPRLSVWENVRCAVLWSLQYKYSFWHGIDRLRDARERTEHILHEINLVGRREVAAGVLTY